MLRVFGVLVTVTMALTVFLALDFNMARKLAATEDPVELTVEEYLRRIPDRFASTSTASQPQGLPTRLADMLPRAPEGWTLRPAMAEDADVFQPKPDTEVDREARGLVADAGSLQQPYGPEVETLTYEKANQRVMIRALRYDDAGFGEGADPDDLFAALTVAPMFRGAPVLTVRGLDVTEDVLPQGFRARLFMADVGGQIHLRILTPKAMTDRELLPFLETLNVAAMNASVVLSEPGLGALPQIVLGAEMTEAGRAAYTAGRAARAQARADRATLMLADARAATGEALPEAGTALFDCTRSVGDIKRCTLGD